MCLCRYARALERFLQRIFVILRAISCMVAGPRPVSGIVGVQFCGRRSMANSGPRRRGAVLRSGNVGNALRARGVLFARGECYIRARGGAIRARGVRFGEGACTSRIFVHDCWAPASGCSSAVGDRWAPADVGVQFCGWRSPSEPTIGNSFTPVDHGWCK